MMNNNYLPMRNQMMRMGFNPNMIIQNLIRQKPQFEAYLNQMQSSGMSPQQFVMQYAKQNGIDINQVQQRANQMMNQMGIRL